MATLSYSTSTNSTSRDEVYLRLSPVGTAVYIAVYTPIILLSVVGNGMVILAFIRVKVVRKINNYYILNLAVTDFLTGLVALPLAIFNRLIVSPLTCTSRTRSLLFMPAYVFTFCSLCFLLALTIDRYVAISRPLRYPVMMTHKRTVCIVCFWWVFGALFGTLPAWTFGESAYQWVCSVDRYASKALSAHAMITTFLIPSWMTVLAIIYSRIFQLAFSEKSGISASRSTVGSQISKRARLRTTVTCAIILGTFTVCYLPTSFKTIYENYFASDITTLLVVQTTAEMMGYSASFVNPIIYGLRNQHFREAYKRILMDFGCIGYRGRPKKLGLSTLSLHVTEEDSGIHVSNPTISDTKSTSL